MATPSSDLFPGVFIVLALLPVFYAIGRAGTAIGDVRSAYLLAPLAPVIAAHVERKRRRLVGTFQGWPVAATFERRTVGTFDKRSAINAFSVTVSDQPGAASWHLQFRVTGTLGQGGRELAVAADDDALRTRLEQSGVVADVGAVSGPTLSYVTVRYDAGAGELTYTDDVSPRRVPSPARFAQHLALVARLVALNARVNPA